MAESKAPLPIAVSSTVHILAFSAPRIPLSPTSLDALGSKLSTLSLVSGSTCRGTQRQHVPGGKYNLSKLPYRRRSKTTLTYLIYFPQITPPTSLIIFLLLPLWVLVLLDITCLIENYGFYISISLQTLILIPYVATKLKG